MSDVSTAPKKNKGRAPIPAATQLILAPIDLNAPGSFRLENERKRTSRRHLDAIEEHNQLVDQFNELREAVIAAGDPGDPEMLASLEAVTVRLTEARRELQDSRDAYHAYFIKRLSTNDGSPVEAALDRISFAQFMALIAHDQESVTVPN